MPARLPRLVATAALAAGLASACGAGGASAPFERPAALDVALESRRGGTSHEAGSNCMACHQAQGLGKGRFTVAGTAWTASGAPHANATVTVATSGGFILTLETDASGSFYTTAPTPAPEQPLFLTVSSASGGSIAMPFPTASGACNMCHVGRQRLVLEEGGDP